MPKFYVVWVGKKPGLYDSWETCKEQVIGFPASKYKSFPNQRLAEVALGIMDKSAAMPEDMGKMALTVDAAYSSSTGKGECRAVLIPCGREMFRAGPWGNTTNNIMEFIAIAKGLKWIHRRAIRIPLFTDSAIAISWVRDGGICRTTHRPPKGTIAHSEMEKAEAWLKEIIRTFPEMIDLIKKWDTREYGEIPADFNRK
jgi:ribonuclease HI